MRTPNPELGKKIRNVALNLLMTKEPEEIRMRDIANACAVSATTIYYYYADKERLFDAIKLDCLEALDGYITSRVEAIPSRMQRLRAGLTAFRDWAFENPRISLLVMGRFKPNLAANPEELERYYRTANFAKRLLDEAVAEGGIAKVDTTLRSSLAIAAVWGAIESVLLSRTYPEYWDNGVYFTDRMIDLVCHDLAGKGGMGK